MKFHFTNRKLIETHFPTKTLIGKYQLQDPGEVRPFPVIPSDAHTVNQSFSLGLGRITLLLHDQPRIKYICYK